MYLCHLNKAFFFTKCTPSQLIYMPTTAEPENVYYYKWFRFYLEIQIYPIKFQNDANTNQILKFLIRGEWPSGLKHFKWTGRFLVQIPLGSLPGLRKQPCYEAPSDLLVETWINALINIAWVTLSPQ